MEKNFKEIKEKAIKVIEEVNRGITTLQEKLEANEITADQQKLQDKKNTARAETEKLGDGLVEFVRQDKNLFNEIREKLPYNTVLPDSLALTATDIVIHKNELLQSLDSQIVKTKEELENTVARKQAHKQATEKLKGEIRTAKTTKKTLEKDEISYNAKARKTHKEVDTQLQEIAKKESEISNKREEIATIKSNIKSLKASCQDCEDIIEITRKLDYGSAKIEGDISKFLSQVKEDILQKINEDENNSEIKTKLSEILDKVITEHEQSKGESQKQLEGEVLDSIKVLLMGERDEFDNNKTQLKVDLDQKKLDLESLLSKLEQAKSQLNELRETHNIAQQEKQKVQNDLENARANIEELEKTKDQAKENLSSTEEEIANKESGIKELENTQNQFKNLLSDYEKAVENEKKASKALKDAQVSDSTGEFVTKQDAQKQEWFKVKKRLLKENGYQIQDEVLKKYATCYSQEKILEHATCVKYNTSTKLNEVQLEDFLNILGETPENTD